ncbi:MAG: outer membrane beta-barrel protein [Steroidobacteraceae bacterium]
MIRLRHFTSAALLALSGTAIAAEPANWSGPYVGGSLGYAWQRGSADETILFDTNADGAYGDVVRTGAGANAFSPGFCGGFANTNAPAGGCRKDDDGPTLAVHAGYDWQRANWLFGAVAEVGRTRLTDSVSAYSTTPASYAMTRDIDIDSAIRGRIGLVRNDLLVYVTGGLTYAKFDNRFASTNTANAFTGNGDDDAWGWVAGIGLEQQVGERWTAGVLAKYTRYNADGYVVNASRGTAPATNPFVITPAGNVNFARSKGDFDNVSASVTLSYRLGER